MSDLDNLAADVRQIYAAAYRTRYQALTGRTSTWGETPIPKWDGGQGAYSNHYHSIWHRIARFCLDNQIDPATLVRAVFMRRPSDLPTPNTMYGAAALAAVEAHRRRGDRDLVQTLRAQESHFLGAVMMARDGYGMLQDDACRFVLQSPSAPLSGLFRYCMASAANDLETAALFEPAALRQYLFERESYDRAWGAVIPPGLRIKARNLRAVLGG